MTLGDYISIGCWSVLLYLVVSAGVIEIQSRRRYTREKREQAPKLGVKTHG